MIGKPLPIGTAHPGPLPRRAQARRRMDPGVAVGSSPLAKIENISLQERVYRALRDALLEGRYMPGEPLSIRTVAGSVGASAQPVREALARLCAEGAIELLPNRMFRVRAVDATRLRELWHLRSLLEADAAALAAVRVDDVDVARLRAINESMRRAVRSLAVDELLAINTEWHFSIYRACGSALEMAVIENLWLQMAPLVTALTRHQLLTDGHLEGLLAYIDGQEPLMDTLEAHDAERARTEMTRILARSREHFLALYHQGALNA